MLKELYDLCLYPHQQQHDEQRRPATATMTAEAGMRVLRGPDWQGGDADGGEGHLGTIRALLGDGRVRVLWDNGQETTCKAGADGKYELRILDTAPVGESRRGCYVHLCIV